MPLASSAPTSARGGVDASARAGVWKPGPRHPRQVFNIAADLVSISLAFAATLKLRLALGGWLFTRLDAQALARLTPPIWLVLSLWLVSAWWARLYRPGRGRGPVQTAIQVIEAMGLATALTALLSVAFYATGGGLSRAFLALLFVVGVTCALTLRSVIWLGVSLTRSRSRPESVLIVGDGENALKLVRHFRQLADHRIAVCGIIATASQPAAFEPATPVLGTIGDLRYAVNQTHAERVLVADTELPWDRLAECVDVCSAMQIPLNYSGGGLTRFPTVVEVTEVAGIRLLEVRRQEFEGLTDLAKRTTDVVVATTLLLALAPLFAVLAVTIKWSSPGPVLFVADRVGRGGRHFRFLKFRSMVHGADARRPGAAPDGQLDGHVFKAPNDARITPVGRWMRRLSLDELPQLLNVIRGDMSLVGPRPLPARDLDPDGLSARYRAWSVERATIRPGLTGLWQIRGRSNLPFEEMVRLDLLYVRTRSYRLDLQILLETVPVVISGRGAM